MTVAKGINKVVTLAKQAALGTVFTGAGGQMLRRRTSVFTANRATFAADEIVSHQQSTGVGLGMRSVNGRIDGLLTPATYKLLMAGLLRKDFAATTPMAAGTDVTPNAAGTFTDASAGFLSAGLKVGDVGRWTGWSAGLAGMNSKNFLITSLTSGVMTGVFLNGDAVVTGSSGDNVTFTVQGKKTRVPTTAHTDDYFTVEEYYADLTKSELFGDCRPNTMALGFPATGNATFQCEMLGLSRTLSASQQITGPAAETTTGLLQAANGLVYCDGTAIGQATGVTINIAANASVDGPVIGSNDGLDVSRGSVAVSGQFQALFTGSTIQALYDAESAVSLIVLAVDGETETADFVCVSMGAIKLTGDAPDDGAKGIVRTYPFTAQINGSGGTALAWDQTIITIQDSQA